MNQHAQKSLLVCHKGTLHSVTATENQKLNWNDIHQTDNIHNEKTTNSLPWEAEKVQNQFGFLCTGMATIRDDCVTDCQVKCQEMTEFTPK